MFNYGLQNFTFSTFLSHCFDFVDSLPNELFDFHPKKIGHEVECIYKAILLLHLINMCIINDLPWSIKYYKKFS